MALAQQDLLESLRSADGFELVCEIAERLLQEPIETETTARIGVGWGEHSDTRRTWHNGAPREDHDSPGRRACGSAPTAEGRCSGDKGTRSAGVQRQYSGTAGRTENSQIGVILAYATAHGRTLIDRRLYLPTSWTDGRERCRQAGIDDSVDFDTKVAMAKAMVRRAISDKNPFGWVTADAGYGYSKGWRSEPEQADVCHHPARHRRHPLGHGPSRS